MKVDGDAGMLATTGGTPGPHETEGVGPGFVPPPWPQVAADEVVAVSTADAKAMARRLAQEEALFAGTSTGADVVATPACDSGPKCLTTDLYAGAAGDADGTHAA